MEESRRQSRGPISKFVIEHVEDSLRKEEGEEGYLPRAELIKQIRDKEEEPAELRKENRLLKQLVDKLDAELRRYRAEPFLEEGFQGLRSFDRDLIKLLRSKEVVSSDHILDDLGIDPKETETVKSVNVQLETLEDYGLIQSTPRGWRWVK